MTDWIRLDRVLPRCACVSHCFGRANPTGNRRSLLTYASRVDSTTPPPSPTILSQTKSTPRRDPHIHTDHQTPSQPCCAAAPSPCWRRAGPWRRARPTTDDPPSTDAAATGCSCATASRRPARPAPGKMRRSRHRRRPWWRPRKRAPRRRRRGRPARPCRRCLCWRRRRVGALLFWVLGGV